MKLELVLAISGILIALGAAITTIWQAVLTRRHNKLSVKPMLRIDQNTVPGTKASIVLVNNGVGPAIINSVNYYIDDIKTKSEMNWANILSEVGLSEFRFLYFEISPKESFAVNEKHFLIESQNNISDDIENEIIKKSLNRIDVKIEYKSIYKEVFFTTKKGDSN